MIGIYKITSPNNRVYIGQSIDIDRRWRDHKNSLRLESRLIASFKKHGVENHIFEVLEECEVSQLNERERFYQDKFNVLSPKGLNSKLTSSDDKSPIISQKTRDKMRQSNKTVWTDEMRLKRKKTLESKGAEFELQRVEKIKNTINSRSLEQKEILSKKISEAVKNSERKWTAESSAKSSAKQKNKFVSENTRKRISDSVKETFRLKKEAKLKEKNES